MSFASHEEYFASLPPDRRGLLESIQAKVEALVPGAYRCISYGMPAFKRDRVIFYFAAFKNHMGIHPPVARDAGPSQ